MPIEFTKLHENGNDFILIDEMMDVIIPDDMKEQFPRLPMCKCAYSNQMFAMRK
ncbi:MAG TPA: hypothetical protein O0X64_01170 [Methanocorpusculum sp.]|nr:hypothetical protein [Methanocorpusculum sp.]